VQPLRESGYNARMGLQQHVKVLKSELEHWRKELDSSLIECGNDLQALQEFADSKMVDLRKDLKDHRSQLERQLGTLEAVKSFEQAQE